MFMTQQSENKTLIAQTKNYNVFLENTLSVIVQCKDSSARQHEQAADTENNIKATSAAKNEDVPTN